MFGLTFRMGEGGIYKNKTLGSEGCLLKYTGERRLFPRCRYFSRCHRARYRVMGQWSLPKALERILLSHNAGKRECDNKK